MKFYWQPDYPAEEKIKEQAIFIDPVMTCNFFEGELIRFFLYQFFYEKINSLSLFQEEKEFRNNSRK